ncbi:tryptophan transporter [Clostridium tetani]|uniref:Tryptophan transporter n=1 Tax=Clostridium tetani TaxID=1513 RepID=A0A4Q0VFM0_CLOTA|nr:tryptophan transporter [Clostridium tetani]RXI50421.1 tryptophan transporter [Clostridium tetani]BDR66424.1 tryptophan transporter [Clostridium tetani]BDR69232.1 tryptophan transporter [Clostridium tetani]BDR71925.1 tryptophan transporter [Clostridium tetani]BDR80401.1 tryptophan transporter [Clostridium tetani]
MKLRDLVLTSVFLAIGFILHQITPPLFLGMKPDFLLIMMFISIYLVDNYKTTMVIGLCSGVLTAMTTTFPGGQLPNLIDKIATCQIVYLLFKILDNKFRKNINIVLVSIIGTFISGAIFLGSAFYIVGLPASFKTLILSIVLPATLFNACISFLFFKVVLTALTYSKSA